VSRNFGRWLNWFIMAGEVYTAFAFLGASGWAYAKGGTVLLYFGIWFFGIYGRLLHFAENLCIWTQPLACYTR